MLRVLCLLLGILLPLAASARDVADEGQWESYTNERFGFSLRYPKSIFSPAQTAAEHDGQLFVGLRGQGRLLVGALRNNDKFSLDSYQQYIAKQSWSKFNISYATRGSTWFVISGEGEGEIFYEKVMFSCRGNIINSFAMIYPSESRDSFAPVVEGIEKSFRPGTAECANAAENEQPATTTPVKPRVAPSRQASRPRTAQGERSAMADRIARSRGRDVLVVTRRTTYPYDYKVLRGYVSR